MPDTTTTGVRDPDNPDRWLVPPWPAHDDFSDIVIHFLWHDPQWDYPSTAQLLAYFDAYRTALEAPTDQPANASEQRWRDDIRTLVARCAQRYRDELATETARQEPGTVGAKP
ncbi:hypothetical protein [Actinophytocola sediminis]